MITTVTLSDDERDALILILGYAHGAAEVKRDAEIMRLTQRLAKNLFHLQLSDPPDETQGHTD